MEQKEVVLEGGSAVVRGEQCLIKLLDCWLRVLAEDSAAGNRVHNLRLEKNRMRA